MRKARKKKIYSIVRTNKIRETGKDDYERSTKYNSVKRLAFH